mmetsp:Transcript_3154/g.7014  ORF Transcript_3154/g.7014 Transcript_3154/m.7014 type:complete len:250 (-) Transcript_3154:944-1693(-)
MAMTNLRKIMCNPQPFSLFPSTTIGFVCLFRIISYALSSIRKINYAKKSQQCSHYAGDQRSRAPHPRLVHDQLPRRLILRTRQEWLQTLQILRCEIPSIFIQASNLRIKIIISAEFDGQCRSLGAIATVVLSKSSVKRPRSQRLTEIAQCQQKTSFYKFIWFVRSLSRMQSEGGVIILLGRRQRIGQVVRKHPIELGTVHVQGDRFLARIGRGANGFAANIVRRSKRNGGVESTALGGQDNAGIRRFQN